MDTFKPEARNFRYYNDDGTALTATAFAAENINIILDIAAGNKQIHMRQLIQEVGGVDGGFVDDYTVQFQENGSGGWTTVTASSSVVRVDTSSQIIEGFQTTDRASEGLTGGTGIFDVEGEGDSADGICSDRQVTANNYIHNVWGLEFVSADWGSTDFVEFRMRINGGAMAGQTQTPRVTKQVFTPDADKFRFYFNGTESGSSPRAAENVNLPALAVDSDVQVQIRWGIRETQGKDGATTDDYRLQKALNAGGFDAIDGLDAIARPDLASALITGNDTTNRATDGLSDPSGTFDIGEQTASTDVLEVSDRQLTADDFTEHVYGFVLQSAGLSDADFVEFRVTLNGGTNDDNISSIIARITVTKGAAPPVQVPGLMRIQRDRTLGRVLRM